MFVLRTNLNRPTASKNFQKISISQDKNTNNFLLQLRRINKQCAEIQKKKESNLIFFFE